MTKTMRIAQILLLGVFFYSQNSSAQTTTTAEGTPVFTPEKVEHDFGFIQEEEGFASYTFKFVNTGTAPLIVSHVQSSCGCAEPEWTPEPVEPGKTGYVTITYDAMGRPGPFKKNITVYTNERNRRQRLSIIGDVVPKPEKLQVAFHDSIGTLELEHTDFLFYTMRPRESMTQEIWIRNYAKENLKVVLEGVPEFLEVSIPNELESAKAGRLKVLLNGAKIDTRGRVINSFVLKTIDASGKVAQKKVKITTHFIDDFTILSPSERKNGPSLLFSAEVLDFGKVKKSGLLSFGSKRVSKQVVLTNQGQAPLVLHSVSIEDKRVEISGLTKKALAPGASITLTLSVHPKDIDEALAADLYVVCNDPSNPIRDIKILVDK